MWRPASALTAVLMFGASATAQIEPGPPSVLQATKPSPVPTPRAALTLRGNDFGWLNQKLALLGRHLDQIDPPALINRGSVASQNLMQAIAICDAVNFEFNKSSFSAALAPEQRSDAELKELIGYLCADLRDVKSDAGSLQTLRMQESLQKANQSYVAVSNVMKLRHDTAKAVIQNIRP